MVSLPNLIIVCYPVGAGGKTIINSLALSSKCAFQYSQLIDGIENKEKFLLSQFPDIKVWNDLNMGDNKFFGKDYLKQIEEGSYNFSKVLFNCVQNNLYAFITAHTQDQYSIISKYFKDCKVIQLTNVVYFTNGIRKYQEQDYESVRGIDWPKKIPVNLTEVESSNLNESIKSEIRNYFNIWPEYVNLGDKFDCMNFLSESSFLSGIRILYNKFGLLDYQEVEPSLKRYYNKWKDFNLTKL